VGGWQGSPTVRAEQLAFTNLLLRWCSDTEDDDDDDQFEVLIDRTSDTFVDSLFELYDQTPVELMRGRQLNVTFVGEAGIDGGAVSREFFFVVFEALLSRPICGRCAFQVGNSVFF